MQYRVKKCNNRLSIEKSQQASVAREQKTNLRAKQPGPNRSDWVIASTVSKVNVTGSTFAAHLLPRTVYVVVYTRHTYIILLCLYICTFSCLRTLSIKKDQQFSRVSCWPADFTSFLIPLMMVLNFITYSPKHTLLKTICLAHIILVVTEPINQRCNVCTIFFVPYIYIYIYIYIYSCSVL